MAKMKKNKNGATLNNQSLTNLRYEFAEENVVSTKNQKDKNAKNVVDAADVIDVNTDYNKKK